MNKTIAKVLSALVCCLFLAAPAKADTIVLIETSLGDIMLRLDERRAPITVDNFVKYAKAGYYDGTCFHRVIKDFMIQGGGFTPDLKEKRELRAPIKNESSNNLRNAPYTIAMARTSAPDSATSQFFINTKENRFLDADKARDGVGYAVFGRVIKGKEVVDKIAAVRTSNNLHRYLDDVPVEPVIIKRVTLPTGE